ncbi:hypothetical protein ABBQ38_013315 [Trebouxia sp. C0009 RCD-2024]
MNGTQNGASPASSKHAQSLEELRQRISQDENVASQLRTGGEPGMLGTSGVDDQTLLRFLKAEKYNVSKAEQRLRSHAAWRKEYVPRGRIQESEVQPELDADKTFLQGCDKLGRPLTICVINKHSKSKRQLEQTKRYIAYSLDNSIHAVDLSKNPTGKTCAIFDLRGLSFDSMDKPVLEVVFDLLQNHYPERLGKLWMYDAPVMFWAVWQLVSPFIDPDTKEKVTFVSSKSAVQEFQQAIDPSVLPKGYGGQAEMILLQDYVKQHILPKQQAAQTA